MLDINLIKKEPENIKKKLQQKKFNIKIIDELIKLDDNLKKLMQKQQTINAERNEKSKLIAELIKNKSPEKEIIIIKNDVNAMKLTLDKINAELSQLEITIRNETMVIPNICDDSVPFGTDEKENKEIKKFMQPTKFDFAPIPHWDLGEKLNLFLPEIATKITGSRFITYYNQGAKLYRALQQFTLDANIEKGFIEVLPQVIVNSDSLLGSGQLPKFAEDLFKLENLNYYLSPTAEVQLTSIYRNTIIDHKQLPIKLTANTPCFRSEAGSAGKDTRGVIRLHQFHKTELMCYSFPETSFEVLEMMTSQAESILEALELPYRRIVLCTGDTGFSAAKTYDIEVWLPSYNDYKEISSCSNCTDFQARRAKIRFKDQDGNNKLVHTLNGSSLAIDRLWVAVVENYQNKDGSITIPKVLQSYMRGQTKITL